jgi:DNA helicase-2/ATP-dependent DNA helicase PcrA
MNELEQILQHIDNGKNFLLSGGAGSGKTYSLVQVIKEIITQNPAEKVFCMTYTNIAVKEIEERVNHKNLKVSTIHDFLWSNIKHFQKEIKSSLIALANDEESRIKIDNSSEENIPADFFDSVKDIKYKEYLKIKDGIISHDEIILLAEYMFKTYVILSDILKDKFKFIFVDEYQDTHKEVVDILLIHLRQSNRKNIIGFFGDSMQSIYENGVDDINVYINDNLINEVLKQQNRRSPQLIIDLANRLRTDGVIQEASTDTSAPNVMADGTVKQGNIKFIYSSNPDLNIVREYLGWNFEDSKNIKELNLTHNLIANKAGFENLMAIYDKDQILNFRTRIKKYIKDFSIEEDFTTKTFGEVIEFLQNGKAGAELKKVSPTPAMKTFIDGNLELYEYAKNCDYSKFVKIYLDKDQLLDDKKQTEDEEKKKGSNRDNLIKHLHKIESNISLYLSSNYNQFIKVTDYKINSIQDKRELKIKIESLTNVDEKTIEEVINEAHECGICIKDDKFNKFFIDKEYVYNRVKEVKYSEFQKLFIYLEGKTPFTTQHKTKGAEFDNVFVILDNGKWSQYNFENLFLENGSDSVLKRTQKLFYVCCTRTKENLVIFYHEPLDSVVEKAKEWFGEDNVIAL